jgi:uncharacterized protein DUF4154
MRAPVPIAGVCVAAILIAGPLPYRAAAANAVDEYQVKAAFIYNFAKFVEWPGDASGNSFDICVAGSDPFGAALDGIIRGKALDGRPLSVRRLKRTEDALTCRLLFFGAMNHRNASLLLTQLRNQPVLTVGEGREFPAQGGIVGFYVLDQRVRFEINREAAARAHLKISSKLLSVATLCTEEAR